MTVLTMERTGEMGAVVLEGMDDERRDREKTENCGASCYKNIETYITFEQKTLYPRTIFSVHTNLQYRETEHDFKVDRCELSEEFMMED